jgi:hypothetical protein
VKALESGFLVTGIGTGAEPPILEYLPCPPEVARVWRDALAEVLELHSHRPNRPVKRIDWLGLAASVDREWALEQGWSEG